MSDITHKRVPLPHINDELLWKIFSKSHHKTVGKCRMLSKKWRHKLSSPYFVKQHFMENKLRDKRMIIGVGYLPFDEKSKWFLCVDVASGQQFDFNIPIPIDNFGYYVLIGSDQGNICLKFSQGGFNSTLMILNPLTRRMAFVTDKARKHCSHAVSLYAFGYVLDTIEYRIVHVYKKHYKDKVLSWTLYNSYEAEWTYSGNFQTKTQKLGPKNIVDKGVVYWIGWEGVRFEEPTSIITFSLQSRLFSEVNVPHEVRSSNNSLTNFNNGVGFISYNNIGFTREVVVWEITPKANDKLGWEKMIKVSGIGIPYNPTIFVGKDIISVMEFRGSFGSANDSESTDLLISRFKFMTARRKHLLHRNWNENVYVKSISMHLQGLYPV
ncbi:hypothetical protein HN51_006746 [Arachis hypogaea]